MNQIELINNLLRIVISKLKLVTLVATVLKGDLERERERERDELILKDCK